MDTSYSLLLSLKEERLQVLEVVGSFKKIGVFSSQQGGHACEFTACDVSTKPAQAQARQNPDIEERQVGIKAHIRLGVGLGVGLLVFDSFSECENRFSMV